MQDQAAAEGGMQLSDTALLAKLVAHSKAVGAGVTEAQFRKRMGMLPAVPGANGHAKA